MKIIIEIPDKEFGLDIADKFQDFFKRLQAETKEHLISNTNLVCGNYELETIEMFLNAFKEMQIIPDNVGKEVANEEWQNKVKQAREEMATYIEPTTGQWTSGFNNGVNTCIEILDRVIESESK